jgi:hypothetical protein
VRLRSNSKADDLVSAQQTETLPKRGDPGWEKYRGCTRKHRYAEEPILGKDYSIGWARHYRCNFCQGWHLTSKPRSGRQKQ